MVATRAQKAAVAAARPGARFDRLPVDLIAHIALYAGNYDEDGCSDSDDRRDLLALRCACRACEPAVRRAARDHELLTQCYFRSEHTDTRALVAYGKVFGSGCRRLDMFTFREESSEILDAFRGFVAHTQGRLLELDLCGQSYRAGRAFVVELCGLCPQLKELSAGWEDVDGATSASVGGFCEELNRLCPLLESVELTNKRTYRPLLGAIAPAESYQMHFSNLASRLATTQ